MYEQDDQNAAEIGRVNADLTRSLKRCSSMVRDYRARLIAANSNDAPFIANVVVDRFDERDEGERTG